MYRACFLILLIASCFAADETAPDATPAVTPYPLSTCIVSDEPLGSMGEPHVFTHEGQEIKLCCKKCLKQFNKDPAGHLAKLGSPAENGETVADSIPPHKCCHDGDDYCCGTAGCCTETACTSKACPSIATQTDKAAGETKSHHH